MTEPADAQLVARLRGGDATALEAVMSEYGGRVYRLAWGITRDHGDARDRESRRRRLASW